MHTEQTVKQLLQTTPKPSGSHDPEAIATEGTAVVQSSQIEVHVPAEQHVVQTGHSAPSTSAQPGRGKRNRAKLTAASLVLARKRLRRCADIIPNEVPDEELAVLLELHNFGESVIWPAGWSAVKAAVRLTVPQQPG